MFYERDLALQFLTTRILISLRTRLETNLFTPQYKVTRGFVIVKCKMELVNYVYHPLLLLSHLY